MADANIENMLDMQLAADSFIEEGVTEAKGIAINWRLVKVANEKVIAGQGSGSNHRLLGMADLGRGRLLRIEIESVEQQDEGLPVKVVPALGRFEFLG